MEVPDVSANRIRQIRRHATGYSLADVAFLLGLKGSAIVSRWETGAQLPSLENTVRLCFILGAPLQDLLPGLCAEAHRKVEERRLLWRARRKRGCRFNLPKL